MELSFDFQLQIHNYLIYDNLRPLGASQKNNPLAKNQQRGYHVYSIPHYFNLISA